MILDSKGRPMSRQAGFIGGMVPEHQARPPLASCVGFMVEREDEDENEEDVARQGTVIEANRDQ